MNSSFITSKQKSPKRIKVVQINAVYEYSSTGRTTKEMHEFLTSNGFDSYVFCANKEAVERNIFRVGNNFDHKTHAISSRILGLQGYFSYLPTTKVIRRLSRIKPDIVILRNLHANYINIPMLLRYLGENDIPTIIVLHDCYFFTGHCCYYFADQCYKWKVECNHCPILHQYNKSLFLDRSKKIFNDKKKYLQNIHRLFVVGVSDWVTNEARLSPVFENAIIIKRIYNWIDQEVFYPRDVLNFKKQVGVQEGEFVVLGVAQIWDELKGLSLFIELAKHMPQIKILLVGKLERNDLPGNMIAVGTISKTDQLAIIYSLADVLVNFSIQETFGKVAAESLSCGTPVIANDSTANPELCGKGCGKIVKSRDWREVKRKVEEVIKEGKHSYTQSCRSFAVKNFNKERGLSEYVDLFYEIIR